MMAGKVRGEAVATVLRLVGAVVWRLGLSVGAETMVGVVLMVDEMRELESLRLYGCRPD